MDEYHLKCVVEYGEFVFFTNVVAQWKRWNNEVNIVRCGGTNLIFFKNVYHKKGKGIHKMHNDIKLLVCQLSYIPFQTILLINNRLIKSELQKKRDLSIGFQNMVKQIRLNKTH